MGVIGGLRRVLRLPAAHHLLHTRCARAGVALRLGQASRHRALLLFAGAADAAGEVRVTPLELVLLGRVEGLRPRAREDERDADHGAAERNEGDDGLRHLCEERTTAGRKGGERTGLSALEGARARAWASADFVPRAKRECSRSVDESSGSLMSSTGEKKRRLAPYRISSTGVLTELQPL